MATNWKFAAARSRYLLVNSSGKPCPPFGWTRCAAIRCDWSWSAGDTPPTTVGQFFVDRHTRQRIHGRILLAEDWDQLSMQRPNVDDDLTLLTDFGKTEAICIDVLENPATEEGVLLKVMARGPFEQGQQVWIMDRDGSKIGATVEDVSEETIDSEVTLSTVLPA